MGFASLQHMRHRRYAFHGRCLPATFRLQGLATLLTVYSLRSRASFISHRQRSWDLPFGAFSSWKVTGRFRLGRTHVPFARRYTHTPKCGGRLDKPQFLGFDPSESPVATRRVFSTPTAGCSLGLDPSRAADRNLDRDFAQSPLTRFSTRLTPRRRRLRVSIGPCSTPSARLTEAIRVRMKNPHRVSAPSRS
jgi:hypothetical protein